MPIQGKGATKAQRNANAVGTVAKGKILATQRYFKIPNNSTLPIRSERCNTWKRSHEGTKKSSRKGATKALRKEIEKEKGKLTYTSSFKLATKARRKTNAVGTVAKGKILATQRYF